jgi:hypothetical protein
MLAMRIGDALGESSLPACRPMNACGLLLACREQERGTVHSTGDLLYA